MKRELIIGTIFWIIVFTVGFILGYIIKSQLC